MTTATVSINGGPHHDLGTVREALDEVIAAKRKRKPTQTEAFTPEETGEKVAGAELRQFIERVERLEEEKQAIAEDIRDIYGEAKGRGFDTTAIRAIVRLRKLDSHEREEREAILDLYKSALGMG